MATVAAMVVAATAAGRVAGKAVGVALCQEERVASVGEVVRGREFQAAALERTRADTAETMAMAAVKAAEAA